MINKKNQKLFTKGNESLPSPGNKTYVSKEEFIRRTSELKKCKEDPVYFANHYYTIISLSAGETIIKLYPKQEELLKTMVEKDRVVVLASRQTGKCLFYTSKIKVCRKQHLNEIEEISIGDFFNRLKINKIHNEKFIEEGNASDWLVYTDKGLKQLLKAYKTIPFKVFNIKTKSYELKCADTHIVFNKDMQEVFIKDLKINDKIQTENGIEDIIEISCLDELIEQNMYDLELDNNSDHRFYSNGILSHNSTTYCIFCLWMTMFHRDKKILICANKEKVALEFIDRIQFAFTLMPFWLKPGVEEWNKSSLTFSNNCKIEGMATSADAGRSKSCNVLILDEFAFVQPNIAEKMWNSVYPIVSSALGSKVIMVSTPCGTGNIYYETYNKAILGVSEEGWTPFKILWNEIGRPDPEKWKQKQIESLNGDMKAWAQEFECSFLSSSQTLINLEVLQKYIQRILSNKNPIEVSIGNLEGVKLTLWNKPIKDHVYVCGVDTAEGIGGDFSVITVLDVTIVSKTEQVAVFSSSAVSTNAFSYVVNEVGKMFNNAPLIIESNSIGKSIIDALWNVYEYENIVNFGTKNDPTKQGIFSQNTIKTKACLWLKQFLENENANILLKDKYLIYELETFERKNGVISFFRAAGNKKDDRVMSLCWAVFALHPEVVETVFIVEKYVQNSFNKTIPEKLCNFQNNYYSEYTPSVWNENSSKETENTSDVQLGLVGDELIDDNTPISLGFFN